MWQLRQHVLSGGGGAGPLCAGCGAALRVRNISLAIVFGVAFAAGIAQKTDIH